MNTINPSIYEEESACQVMSSNLSGAASATINIRRRKESWVRTADERDVQHSHVMSRYLVPPTWASCYVVSRCHKQERGMYTLFTYRHVVSR